MSSLARAGALLALASVAVSCSDRPAGDDRVRQLEQRVEQLEARLAELPADLDALAGADVDELSDRLGSGDDVLRYRAARELARRGEEGRQRLAQLLESGTERQQLAAAATLATESEAGDVQSLLPEHASEEDATRRAMLALALGRTGSPEAVPPLSQDLEHPARRVRLAAAVALGRLGQAVAAPALLRAALERDPMVAEAAADSLRRLGDRATPFLAGEWMGMDPRSRRSAIRTLGEVPGPQVDAFLRTALEDASPLVALEAALELARRGDASGRTLAQNRLGSDDPAVASAARAVLDALGDTR